MNIRTSGILLHITSLPGPFGIGDLGPEAFRFADFLSSSGQRFWQVLPLNPVDPAHGGSPYHSNSAFAGNVLLISPERLVEDGLLERSDLTAIPEFPEETVDFTRVADFKAALFDKAYERFKAGGVSDAYAAFCEENRDWLADFALYQALTARYRDASSWAEWPRALRDRDPKTLASTRQDLADAIRREQFLQFLFYRQWRDLKEYCNRKGIQLFGDMPIYMPYDCADVWAHQSLFQLDEEGKPEAVSGVPPDYFSETGQLWGHPLYRWDRMRKNGYQWWFRRIRQNLTLFDYVRIDHFRGLQAYWEVQAGEETALNGRWVEGPGSDLFRKLSRKFSCLPIVAEDLGTITPDVRELMQEFDLPGMRLLLFAFGDDFPEGAYLPHNVVRNCIVYTGTHDNNTVRGWYENEASEANRENLFRYLGRLMPPDELPWELIRLAMISVANTAIFPMQDILGLGEEARMNRPASTEKNWQWRLSADAVTPAVLNRLLELTRASGRCEAVEEEVEPETDRDDE